MSWAELYFSPDLSFTDHHEMQARWHNSQRTPPGKEHPFVAGTAGPGNRTKFAANDNLSFCSGCNHLDQSIVHKGIVEYGTVQSCALSILCIFCRMQRAAPAKSGNLFPLRGLRRARSRWKPQR